MLSQSQARAAAKQITTGLTKAFKDLRRHGYFCRQAFQCCPSHSVSEAAKHSDQYAVYNVQAADYLQEVGQVYLHWRGDGAEIVEAIEKQGLDCLWNGEPSAAILVRLA